MPWKRFCLFCLFHASLSIVDCSVQLVYTKFPNRVIYRGHRRFIGQGKPTPYPDACVKTHYRAQRRFIGLRLLDDHGFTGR